MSVTSNLSLRYIGLLVCLAPGTFDRGRLTNRPQSNEHDLVSLKGIDQPSSAIPEKPVNIYCTPVFKLPWWFSGKESACSAGDVGAV